MKAIIAAILILLLPSCSYQNLIDKVPPYSFDSFSYHRSGNVTSADIEAKNSSLNEAGELVVEEVKIKQDYGPAWNVNIQLTGLIIIPKKAVK